MSSESLRRGRAKKRDRIQHIPAKYIYQKEKEREREREVFGWLHHAWEGAIKERPAFIPRSPGLQLEAAGRTAQHSSTALAATATLTRGRNYGI